MKMKVFSAALTVVAIYSLIAFAREHKIQTASLRPNSLQNLQMIDGRAEFVTYRGHRAVHFLPSEHTDPDYPDIMAILAGSDFHNGTIELDVSGAPNQETGSFNRGFVGLAFRVNGRHTGEYFFLRPTNGRADDQLRRNHSLQYQSLPDYSWKRLREENPGVYESYADLEPGAWMHMKIVVSGTKAALYMNGASQPSLIVNDLKHGESHGQIALWAFSGTEAYFTNLRVY